MDFTGLYWAILSYIRFNCDVLSFNELYWDILG